MEGEEWRVWGSREGLEGEEGRESLSRCKSKETEKKIKGLDQQGSSVGNGAGHASLAAALEHENAGEKYRTTLPLTVTHEHTYPMSTHKHDNNNFLLIKK